MDDNVAPLAGNLRRWLEDLQTVELGTAMANLGMDLPEP